MSASRPGWYPDPENRAFVRWWDGAQWTGHVQRALGGAPRVQVGLGPRTPVQPPIAATTAMAAAVAPTPSAPESAREAASHGDAEALIVGELSKLRAEHAALSARVIELREMLLLQEAGIYEYHHPLDSAVAYKERLADVQRRIKDAIKAGKAVKGALS